MKKRSILFFTCLFFCGTIMAQSGRAPVTNATCETAAPFCTGTLYTFPAGVNSGSGQPGPFYGCLLTTPNPAWYYLKVQNPGNIIIFMHSQPAVDIDFCCWGPFTSQNCCGQLTQPKIVSCSYSPNPTETCNIPNGQTGQYYMLIITNFSNQPCNIIFSQTGGSGTTDCSILPPPCISNSPICAGQTLQLSAQTIAGATYQWWGPAGFNSSLQNPSIPNATPANSGEYFLRIVVGGQGSSDTSTTFVNVYHPVANAGNDTTILNGVNTTLHGSCVGGSGSYNYKWAPSSLLVNDTLQNPATVNLFASQIFTLHVTDDSANCQSTDVVTIEIAGSALAVNAFATPSSICFGSTSHLQAYGSGGAGNYTFQWTGPDGFSSTLPDPTVAPTMTSTYQVSVFDGYNTSTGTVTVTVITLPLADAGPPQSIYNGMFTYLNGSVLNGNSNYFYDWSPADKLLDAGIPNPRTVNLTTTTVYTLYVTDLATNCVSTNDANVTVTVIGAPLNVNPVANPGSICKGDSAHLFASAGGGNIAGTYSYQWSSVPAGFTSTESDPVVHPLVNTQYQVTVTDSYDTVTGISAVNIYPDPLIHLGPEDTTVCIYDTVRLDAGNPGSTYLWSNGATSRQISFGTTGIGFDEQEYSVEVTNEHGCKSFSSIEVIFNIDACTGINDLTVSDHFRMFPNPAKKMVTIEADGIAGTVKGSLLTMLGNVLQRFSMQAGSDGSSRTMLDLTGLPKGIYLVRFENAACMRIHKLVIE